MTLPRAEDLCLNFDVKKDGITKSGAVFAAYFDLYKSAIISAHFSMPSEDVLRAIS